MSVSGYGWGRCKGVQGQVELHLQEVACYLTWVLGSELESSVRVLSSRQGMCCPPDWKKLRDSGWLEHCEHGSGWVRVRVPSAWIQTIRLHS